MADPASVPQNRRSFSQVLMQHITVLRTYLRDFPELNRLIEGYESSDRMLAWAIMDALNWISSTPPPLGTYSLTTFHHTSLLLRIAACNVVESVTLLQMRNQLRFSDGGIQVGVSDRAPLLMNWLQMMRARTDQELMRWKVSQNIEQGYDGGVHSDYWYISGYYGG